WRDSHFADPRGRRITLNKVDVDLGRLVKTQQRVIVEVALLDHPIFNRDPCLERGGQAKDDPTLHLGNHAVRVDHRAAIHRAYDAMDPNWAPRADFDLD